MNASISPLMAPTVDLPFAPSFSAFLRERLDGLVMEPPHDRTITLRGGLFFEWPEEGKNIVLKRRGRRIGEYFYNEKGDALWYEGRIPGYINRDIATKNALLKQYHAILDKRRLTAEDRRLLNSRECEIFLQERWQAKSPNYVSLRYYLGERRADGCKDIPFP